MISFFNMSVKLSHITSFAMQTIVSRAVHSLILILMRTVSSIRPVSRGASPADSARTGKNAPSSN